MMTEIHLIRSSFLLSIKVIFDRNSLVVNTGFSKFLNLMTRKKVKDTDSEEELKLAFKVFVTIVDLLHIMTNLGEKLTVEEAPQIPQIILFFCKRKKKLKLRFWHKGVDASQNHI
ncbi:hypothetical protein ZOSMA_12G00100 [Zostera marina]|uniref:Uncharacterized protein n=1 Tax=Zostera marina TaxID=29655 RepID=A0A0K9PZ90_ZOSMR|nr:hypothetical protein ZOSMA_12G00100 [Zostera marina]